MVSYAVHGISVNAVVERNKTIDTKGTPRPGASSSWLLEETLRTEAKSKSGDNNNEGWLTSIASLASSMVDIRVRVLC
jgi:hypothetical protein